MGLGEHLPIAETEDAESATTQRLVASSVTRRRSGLGVLISIQLDDQPTLEADEVHDISRRWVLPTEFDAQGAVSQSLPQAALGVGLLPPELPSKLRRR